MLAKVGFIGTGAMGLPLVRKLLAADISVDVFDTSRTAMEGAVAAGAKAAASVRQLCEDNEIVFACLPSPAVSVQVALGDGGIASGGAVRIYVEMSTFGGELAVELSQKLAERGVTLIDCPIVGGNVALEAGTVGVLAAGPHEQFEQVRFALDAFGGRLFYLSEKAGAAQAGKVMNNAVAHTAFLSTCEAIALGLKAGIDIKTAVDIINQGSGRNFFSELVFPGFILKGRFEGTGAMEIGVKDVGLFVEEAEQLGMDIPLSAYVSDLYKTVLNSGEAGRDTLTALHYFTDLAGVPRQSGTG